MAGIAKTGHIILRTTNSESRALPESSVEINLSAYQLLTGASQVSLGIPQVVVPLLLRFKIGVAGRQPGLLRAGILGARGP